MGWLGKALVRHFVPPMLKQACPIRVLRSGEEGARVNCFNVTVLLPSSFGSEN